MRFRNLMEEPQVREKRAGIVAPERGLTQPVPGP